MNCVEGETGSCSETCVTCAGGTEEVSIKVEEELGIKDEIPEAIKFPSIKTEHEVRLWGVCEVVAAHAFRLFVATKEILKLHLTVSCSVLYCGFHLPFELWYAIMKKRDFWK
jgi:hypothetical protein